MLDELFKSEDESVEKILLSLLDEKGIVMKTDIPNPIGLTKLKVLGILLKQDGADDCEALIENFIIWYMKFRVSTNRKSREEIIKALTAMIHESRTASQKLASTEQTA